MKEIFEDIPQYVRDRAKFWVDLALTKNNPLEGIQMVAEYANSCEDEDEKDYVDFYFNMRLEELING